MKVFKNHKRDGVTILEVMLAVAVASFISLAVMNLQNALIGTTSDASGILTHLRFLNNFVCDSRKKIFEGEEPEKQSVEETGADLTFKKQDYKSSATLAKDLKALIFEIGWQDMRGERKELLAFISYEKPEEDEKKK